MRPDTKRSCTLLVVDDDAADRRAVLQALRKGETEGQRSVVEEAVDGATALAMVMRQDYDCILLDLKLPDSNGLDWLRKLAERGKTPPVLILTGNDDRAMALEAIAAGAQDYLVKGELSPDMLVRSIRYAIERQRILAELESARREIASVAFLDPLTEVLNRRGLEHLLHADLATADRTRSAFTAIVIDCDDFKAVNERHGHSAGDFVLKEVVRRIRSVVRGDDRLARVGGDEFLVLMPGTSTVDAVGLAHRVREAVGASPVIGDGWVVEQRVSSGVFTVPAGAHTATDLLAIGSGVLLRSKAKGKNTVSGTAEVRVLAGEPHLDGETSLEVWSQQIVRIADAGVIGHEIVARWSAGSERWPESLFAQAQDRKALAEIDRQAFATCVRAAAGARYGAVHVNLFWSTLERYPIDQLLSLVPPGVPSLCLEFDIHYLTGASSAQFATRETLRRSGVKMVLDHLDLGARSLEALIALEPDMVKIDCGPAGDPILGLTPTRRLSRLVRVALALGAEVVGVGVESEEVRAALQSAGAEFGQGFLWAAPRAAQGSAPASSQGISPRHLRDVTSGH